MFTKLMLSRCTARFWETGGNARATGAASLRLIVKYERTGETELSQEIHELSDAGSNDGDQDGAAGKLQPGRRGGR